jgi:hypothetical protein
MNGKENLALILQYLEGSLKALAPARDPFPRAFEDLMKG